MASSSSTFSDCSQNDGASVAKAQTCSTNTFEEFLESAALTRDPNHETIAMNASFSSNRELERSKNVRRKDSNSNSEQTLQKTVKAWSEETGRPTTVTVHVEDRSFLLHKEPLVSKSGFLKRMLMVDKEVRLPSDYPGGPGTFEIVASFCYGYPIKVDASNVAELRCASEYLQMSEEYGKANLCEESDLFLSQIASQSWQATMVILLHCQHLYPLAEELRIVSRCVESLASMACTEMVDPPERNSRTEIPVESQFWCAVGGSTRDSSSPIWWMDDLLRLPCGIFERVIAAIRREGMQERYVSQAVVKFVERWVFKGSYSETDVENLDGQIARDGFDLPSMSRHEYIVEAVVRLLPAEKDALPIRFLFSLLRCALACNSSLYCRDQLESRIASQLELATIDDFRYPFKVADSFRAVDEGGSITAPEVSCMRRIVNSFMCQQRCSGDSSEALHSITGNEVPENFYCAYAVSAVAKVWDEYLAEIARDLRLTALKFAELAEVVPSYARATHDHLYRAIHTYLKVHPHFSQEERQLVCRTLNCQRLSPEMCSHAVQNELMPLRMIVQAMFMQQLQTRNVLNGHLQIAGQSMRFESVPPSSTNGSSFRRNSTGYQTRTESFRSTRESFRSRHESFPVDSIGGEDEIGDDGASGGNVLKREAAFRQAALLKADYVATETRLQTLEEELACMKKEMGDGKLPQKKSDANRSNVQVNKCTAERLSSSDRKKRKASLTAVPEVTAWNIEEGAEVGDMELSARGVNSIGFLTKALSLVTLGGNRSRKTDAPDSAAETELSVHILCGGRRLWRNNFPSKNKARTMPGGGTGLPNSSRSLVTTVKSSHS